MAILHVDDQPALREIVSHALKAFGFEAVSADSVREAKLALTTRDDLTGALLDIQLPDGSGVEVFEWIAVNYPRLLGRVAFLTGRADADLNGAVQATGCTILAKPFEIAELARLAADWEGGEHIGPSTGEPGGHNGATP